MKKKAKKAVARNRSTVKKTEKKHKSGVKKVTFPAIGKGLRTDFAPPERLAPKDVNVQSKNLKNSLLRDPIVKLMMDRVPTAVVVLNGFRQIVFANQTFLNFVGAKRSTDVLGKRPGEAVGCIHSTENEAGCGTTEFCSMCGAVQAILISQEGGNAYRECRISQIGGASLDLAVSASPMKIDDEYYTLFAAIDIGHEKRRRLLEKTFFHDILNTSSVLYAYAEAFQDGSAKAIERAGEKIYGATNRLIDEIQAQRQLLAAESNELAITLKPVPAMQLVRNVADSFAAHPAAYGKFIAVDPSSDEVDLMSDAALLGRVVSNMVKNALEAISEGKKVTVKCTRSGANVEISVHNPSYIPREAQLQIFQRSYSTKGAGRGIGTYSMKLLSEKYLGGSVSFTSDKDKGTTFTATYPLEPKKNK